MGRWEPEMVSTLPIFFSRSIQLRRYFANPDLAAYQAGAEVAD